MSISSAGCVGVLEQAYMVSTLIAFAGVAGSSIVLMTDEWPLSEEGRKWLPILIVCVIYFVVGIQVAEYFGICADET